MDNHRLIENRLKIEGIYKHKDWLFAEPAWFNCDIIDRRDINNCSTTKYIKKKQETFRLQKEKMIGSIIFYFK